ncbi:MAG: hypothetical protein EU518_00500 [Promethearchaeota archaeon]|nr:MAG: hypothetical protein EU518_00500 [Candidatus Lokiarchaeota archaeon]
MKEFLEKLNLSENCIRLYLEIIGRSPYTYYELRTILPDIDDGTFADSIEELINQKLLIPIESEKTELLTYYLAYPPITPILNYYSNIEESFTNIKNALQDLVVKSINQIFEKENKVEMESIYNEFKDIKKDFEEDSLLQKKDAEDISKEMDKIKNLETNIEDLKTRIETIVQKQFSNLIKTITQIRKNLIKKIQELELKKREEGVIEAVEGVFKDQVDKMVRDFTNQITTLINQEFEKLPIDSIINKSIQQRNDFKMLLLNLISSFEMKIKKISEVIKTKREDFDPNIQNLKEKILGKINTIIYNSVDQIANLNQPIIRALSNYEEYSLKTENLKIENVWEIETLTEINEQIINTIDNSSEELVIIVPELKDFLKIELFQNLPKNLKVKIASSDPHVNSMVMKFKSINNLEFRHYDNDSFIGLKSDNNLIAMGFINKEEKNPLDNFSGLALNNPQLIKVFKVALYNVWSAAEPDYGGTRRSTVSSKSSVRTSSGPTIPKETPIQHELEREGESKNQLRSSPSEEIKSTEIKESKKVEDKKISEDIGEELRASLEKTQKIKEQKKEAEIPKEKAEKRDYTSKIFPKTGDSAGMEINNAFNSLLQQLNDLTGETFSNKLELIADLILEKRGFSVTLHDLRSTINDYKSQRGLLNIEEQNHIFEKIETWKQKLL